MRRRYFHGIRLVNPSYGAGSAGIRPLPFSRAPWTLASSVTRGYTPRMEKLHFTVQINAPVHTVWTTMLDDATYREWTSAFNVGSYYEGSWDLGSDIRFLGPEEDGSVSGMLGKVIENRPDERVTVEYSGDILHGVERSGAEAQFFGAHESYSFSESGGVTTVEVDVDTEEEYASMFSELWPAALAKLKELAEARV